MKCIRIHPADNVQVVVEAEEGGAPAGHKVALCPIEAGEAVIKYGYPIGHATRRIAAGEHVHTHNLKTNLGDILTYRYESCASPIAPIPPRTFQGYPRASGRVGIRNEIYILPTVGCVNAVGQEIARRAQSMVHDGVEGIYAYAHPHGCSQTEDDMRYLQDVLIGLSRNPNAAGALILGLGCENNHVRALQALMGEWDAARVKFLICQESEDEVEEGVALVRAICQAAWADRREAVPASALCVGLKCGGSDGFSGITANPLVGDFSDALIAQGGTTILTEVPEMFGAETILMNRCVDEAVFQKTVSLIDDFKRYFMRYGKEIYENPSYGNKAGGITTLEEKSLGCTQKGGRAPVVDVLGYAKPVRTSGLNLMQAPGNDLVSSSGLAAAGAQLVLFTTGRGTPFGCPVPTMKIATNSALYEKKRAWMDFDAGNLLTGLPRAEAAAQLMGAVLAIASGSRLTQAEAHGIRDLAVFKDGITM